jgi:ASC-1-like (ASCH) protein
VKVEITDVRRLTLKPGDRLVVRTDEKLADVVAARLYEVIRARLSIPDDVPVMILDRGMSAEVVEGL